MYIKKSSNITCGLAFNHEWFCNVSRIILLVKSEFLYPILIVHRKLSSAGMKGFIFIHISRGIVFSTDYLAVALWNLWQEGEGGTTYTIIVWDCGSAVLWRHAVLCVPRSSLTHDPSTTCSSSLWSTYAEITQSIIWGSPDESNLGCALRYSFLDLTSEYESESHGIFSEICILI